MKSQIHLNSSFTNTRFSVYGDSHWEGSRRYVFEDLRLDLLKKCEGAEEFPAISDYSLTNAVEFFAECCVAFLSGERDWLEHDSRLRYRFMSSEELLVKLPALHQAFSVFFDPENEFYGDLSVFLKRNCNRV